MIGLAIALLSAIQEVGNDYFPINPGVSMTYSDTADQDAELVSVMRDQTEVGGVKVWPVESLRNGRSVGITYYSIDSEAVKIASFSKTSLLTQPRPVFLKTTGDSRWTYEGFTTFRVNPAALKMKGFSHPGKPMKRGTKSFDTLEVTLDATIGVGPGSFTTRQVVVFGKGIGMVRMDETAFVDGRKLSHTVSLTAIGTEPFGK